MKFIVAVTLALAVGFIGVVGFHHFSNRPERPSSGSSARVGQAGWLHSWEEAAAQSRATGRPIVADFTGSDWCPPCMALKSQVFDSQDFKAWAAEKQLILLEVDFPRRKSQDGAIKAQNTALARRLKVSSFPTIILLDADGQPIGGRMSGYGGRGPSSWISQAEASWGEALGG